MTNKQESPASLPAERDSLTTLLKLDDAPILTGLSDGVQAAFAYAPEGWTAQATAVIKRLAKAQTTFDIDDVRRAGIPEPDISQRWGSVFAAMKNTGVIQLVGMTLHRTESGQSHGIRLWQGKPEKVVTD